MSGSGKGVKGVEYVDFEWECSVPGMPRAGRFTVAEKPAAPERKHGGGTLSAEPGYPRATYTYKAGETTPVDTRHAKTLERVPGLGKVVKQGPKEVKLEPPIKRPKSTVAAGV